MSRLPTSSRRRTFSVYTLRSNYDDFVLIASSERTDVDYTWYTPINVEIGSADNDVVLIFEPRELKQVVCRKQHQHGRFTSMNLFVRYIICRWTFSEDVALQTVLRTRF